MEVAEEEKRKRASKNAKCLSEIILPTVYANTSLEMKGEWKVKYRVKYKSQPF